MVLGPGHWAEVMKLSHVVYHESLIAISRVPMARQEAERIQNMDKKLSSLHLDGLVDFSPEAAKFVVLGSTNKHYTITLSDARHTCQCVDFR